MGAILGRLLEEVVEADYDARGMYAVDDSISPGWQAVRYEVRVASPAGYQPDGEVVERATVANTGKRAGSEVLQLYVGDDAASVARPEKELKAFEKVALAAGFRQPLRPRLRPGSC